MTNAVYLEDSGVAIEGLRIWGSPVQPWFGGWAFNRDRGPAINRHWRMIPNDTHILITHGPPAGYLDSINGYGVGCEDLRRRIAKLPELRMLVCGHIHEGYGIEACGPITIVNASRCDAHYMPVNEPIVIDTETTSTPLVISDT